MTISQRNVVKDKIQREGLNKWWQAGGRGTLEYATGIGKSRCGVLAAAYVAESVNYDCQIIIITPSTTIRDNVWEKEFRKWKKMRVFKECVKVVCINTAYKWINQHYDLCIVDEIHSVIPTLENFRNKEYEFFKFFENNTLVKILGLSASLEASRLPVLNKIARVVAKISVVEAKRLGLISNFKVFNFAVELTPEEKTEYEDAHRRFEKYFSIFTNNYGIRDLKIMYKCMKDKDFFMSRCKRSNIDYEKVKSYPFLAQKAMGERKIILYNAKNKIDAAKTVSDKFPERLGILFSQSTDTADKITDLIGDTCVSFHSKIKKKDRVAKLKRLNDGRTRVNRISSVKALNEGLDIPKCSLAIITSGESKQRGWIQRVGRSVRFEEDKTALIVRLYIKGTQEEKWVNSSQIATEEVINITNVDAIVA